MAKLTFQSGPLAGQNIDLPNGPYVIGRHDDCDLAIAEPSVSQRHAQIEPKAGQWLLVDLDSANGTLVQIST